MLRQTNADEAHFKSNEFFQALYDNLVELFPNTEILTAVQVPVWYETLSGVVIRPDKFRHKHRWSG